MKKGTHDYSNKYWVRKKDGQARGQIQKSEKSHREEESPLYSIRLASRGGEFEKERKGQLYGGGIVGYDNG